MALISLKKLRLALKGIQYSLRDKAEQKDLESLKYETQSDINNLQNTLEDNLQNTLQDKVLSVITKDKNGNVTINGNAAYIGNSEDPESAEKLATENFFYEPKKYLVVTDEVDGYNYLVTSRNGNLVSYIQTEYIEVTTMPFKTSYLDNEEFNSHGMVVIAIGVDGSIREITNYTYDLVTTENASNFIISYNEAGIIHTTRITLNIHDFSLIDFEYTINNDGTYTLTAWKGTYNGEPSTRIIVPDSELIII